MTNADQNLSKLQKVNEEHLELLEGIQKSLNFLREYNKDRFQPQA